MNNSVHKLNEFTNKTDKIKNNASPFQKPRDIKENIRLYKESNHKYKDNNIISLESSNKYTNM